jgi:hypothetical protein
VDEEPDRLLVAQLHHELRACCVSQRPSGLDVHATLSIRRVALDFPRRWE